MLYDNNNCCDWCNEPLTVYNVDATVYGTNEKKSFCNLVCSKHYNDLICKIFIDINLYKSYYNNKLLDSVSTRIFQKFSIKGFEFMPNIHTKIITDRKKMCKDYIDKLFGKL